MRLAANLRWMYRELPWPARFAAAANDGFAGVEILLPYDQSPQWYARALQQQGLELVLFNTPIAAGAGELGLAAIPGAEQEFRRGFERARELAQATGCARIHVMAGRVAGLDASACRTTLLRNLDHALGIAVAEGLVLTLEPLNREDMPGYFYQQPAQALDIVRYFDSPHLRLQFDFYHCVKEGLDPQREVQAAAGCIGHVQIAGAAGRHEPELARDGLLDAVMLLPEAGYDSWLACEYAPARSAAEGLAWSEPLRERGVLR